MTDEFDLDTTTLDFDDGNGGVVHDNPLYADGHSLGVNPFYEPPAYTATAAMTPVPLLTT
jgi:hypothetical protein